MPLSQGQVLNKRYRIIRPLGQGGYGAVYRAWDLTLGRPCAVKESLDISPEAQRQFLREAQILARLSHPNLPHVSDYFTILGIGQYLVMDFVEGQNLEEMLIVAGGKLPEKLALELIAQICEALIYLHNQKPPIIHRDIKPANIKITPPDADHPQGKVMLVDFGVAKIFDPSTRTTVGARAVTPGYSPHEQYGQGFTDARSDIYALGATLYTMLTGQAPMESVMRMVRDQLTPPRQLEKGISLQAEAAVMKALVMDVSGRFQSVVEFKDALLAPSGNNPTLKSVRYTAGRWLEISATLLVMLTLIGGVMAVASKWFGNREAVIPDLLRAIVTPASPTSTSSPPVPSPTSTITPTPTPCPTQVASIDGMVLRYITGGTFLMGSDSGLEDEQPVHSVTLDAFWMDQTEVTNGMYALCVEAGVCNPPYRTESDTRDDYYAFPAYDHFPVIYVSRPDAEGYCTWAGRRLPTEAEWEYAARGGLIGAVYPWGNEEPGCNPGAENGAQYSACDPGDTTAVGSFAANGYGLYDMAGNVWEWVADSYDAGYYSVSPTENPGGPESGSSYVVRGGSWAYADVMLRVSNRRAISRTGSSDNVGFRCASTP